MKVEDLIGWRIWRVMNGALWSYSADYAWMPGDIAEGEPGDHDHAGIWAFKDKRRAFQKAAQSGPGFVWGSVRLWGSVVEHSEGYRASMARIVSLDGGSVSREEFDALCETYGVAPSRQPIIPWDAATSVATELMVRHMQPRTKSATTQPVDARKIARFVSDQLPGIAVGFALVLLCLVATYLTH